MREDDFDREIDRCAASVEVLADRSRWNVEREWDEVYQLVDFAESGRWQVGDFRWHVFSYGFTPCRRGARAAQEYLEAPLGPLFILPTEAGRSALSIIPKHQPLFHGQDVIVVRQDFSWTMCFTHEEPDIGPFFSDLRPGTRGSNEAK